MNLAGWIGVAAPPRLGRGWRRKVRGEIRTENNKRNGIYFFICFKRVSKTTLRAVCRLVLFY